MSRARALAQAVRPLLAATAASLLLSGCALTRGIFDTLGPDFRALVAPVAQWQAPAEPAATPSRPSMVAHGGDPAALKAWWRQFDDPLLAELIDAAQRESGTVAQAAARIERARADAVAAGVAGAPSLDATAGANRAAFSFGGPAVLRSQASVGLQSAWEIDLFGGLARQRESAQAQLEANIAAWHDARVALAAEVANAYVNHRYCEMQVALAEVDAASRAETARLTAVVTRAGLQSPAALALAQASAADGAATLAQRRTQCEVGIKGLVALTGRDEPALRALLDATPARKAKLPRPARFAIDAVPARVLAQRPDVAAAERDVAVASAGIGVAEADRYPKLSLSGNITPTRSRLDGSPTISVTTWSIGPSLTLPLLDGGRRRANVEAARAQYTGAEAAYRARVREAVREVEEAMVKLAGVEGRTADTRAAAAGYRESLEAARTRQRAGLGSLIELEDARRTALASEGALSTLEYEGVSAWIALYRAVGGGWDGRFDAPAAPEKK
jgi:NodT family efflux transporter outer membrane factor (OMF) lipoprotein